MNILKNQIWNIISETLRRNGVSIGSPYQVEINEKPKYYVLDMFPYPSGAGLHVGHPLGYIASDIYSRYKRLQGFNVLHPMGYDAYGLPAEQYAIQTGQHPAITTVNNINRYREQLDKIGFSFDWNREVRTCDPKYYHWTQWAFQKMFNSFYCNTCGKAQPIEKLIAHFEEKGTEGLDVACSEELSFTAEEWKAKSEKEQQEILMNYRIAYLGETMVNWCPELGTVLSNDEVIEGVSDSGGPLRFVANYTIIPMQKGISYAGRYLSDLSDNLDTLEEVRAENEELQSKVDQLSIDNTRLRQEQYELERLRELYQLDENYADYKKTAAHVIANNGSNWFNDFTIDKGSNDGIKVDCNVLAGSGLAGIVTEVGPDYARVRSIIDDSSNISAMILSTSDICMVRGDLQLAADGRIRFENLPNNDNDR